MDAARKIKYPPDIITRGYNIIKWDRLIKKMGRAHLLNEPVPFLRSVVGLMAWFEAGYSMLLIKGVKGEHRRGKMLQSGRVIAFIQSSQSCIQFIVDAGQVARSKVDVMPIVLLLADLVLLEARDHIGHCRQSLAAIEGNDPLQRQRTRAVLELVTQ